MKFSDIIALASAASCTPLQKKQAQPTDFEIQDFTADCTVHSTECNYNFAIVWDPAQPPSHCSAVLQGFGQLPEVADGQCSDNPALTWAATKTPDGGLDLSVGYKWPFNACYNLKYCHLVPAGLIATENNGASTSQHYTGPLNFGASVFEC
ncbi:hypothetical protein SCUP515_10760 [Seiridium cupressi]